MGKLAMKMSIFAIAMCCTQSSAQDASIPNFSPSSDVGWIPFGPEFIPPPSGPQPVASDPAHPFIANAIEYRAGQPDVIFPDRQPTFPVADLTNPILQPWAREELRKINDIVLSGKPVFERRTGCWPSGVPAFNLYVVLPNYFHSDADQLSNIALLTLLKRMDRTDITPHGFRSTFRDWTAEQTDHTREVAEIALGHRVTNQVEAAYRRGDLFEKRRRLREEWAQYCVPERKIAVINQNAA